MIKKMLLFVTLSLLSTSAFADVAKPKGKLPEPVDTYLAVKLDPSAKEAKLIVPLHHIRMLRAQLDSIDGGDANAAAITAGGISRTQTIVSGLFISLAIGLGGVWFVRSGSFSTRSGKGVAAGMLLFAGGAFATIVYGNAGPPAEARSITGKMFSPALHVYKGGGGKISLEVSHKVDEVVLIVPDAEEAKKAAE